MEKKTRPFEYYAFCLTMISSYFGRTIPLSTFHQHYLSTPKVEVTLLHFSKVNMPGLNGGNSFTS